MSTVCSRAFDTTTSREPATIAADAVVMRFNRGRERRGVVPRLCGRLWRSRIYSRGFNAIVFSVADFVQGAESLQNFRVSGY